MADGTPRAYYVTALDRIGLAVLAGGALAGLAALLLTLGGGERSPAALGAVGLLGGIVAMMGIVGVLGPVWLVLHRSNRRGPGAAAAAAGLVTLAVLTVGQTWGGTAGGGYRLASALATSLIFALAAAGVGAVMQRVAYRRLM